MDLYKKHITLENATAMVLVAYVVLAILTFVFLLGLYFAVTSLNHIRELLICTTVFGGIWVFTTKLLITMQIVHFINKWTMNSINKKGN